MKTTMLAAVVALTLAGCGSPENPGQGGANSVNQPAAAADVNADLWAEEAYAIYGADAVRTCLAGFHAEYSVGARGNEGEYRAALGEYMCACARGQSRLACPQP
jgi:hypothetical protein